MRPSPLLLVAAVLVSVLCPATAGAALPAETARPAGPSVLLTGQPPWVAPEGTAMLSLRVNGPTDDLLVRVSAHRAVTSRSAFERAIDGKGLGALEGRLTVPVDELEEDGNGGRYFPIPVQAANAAGDADRPLPGRSGVYPLLVELRRRGVGTVSSFVTPVTVLAPGVVPLTVSWVWRLDATPARTPAGTVGKAAAKAFASGGRLDRMAEAAASFPDVPLTLAPTPETLEAWAETSQAATLRAAVLQPNRQVLGGPFVTPDTPALLAAGLPGEVDAQFARGSEIFERTLGKAVPPTTLLAGPLDAATLSRLRQYGVARVVVEPDQLEPVEQRLTPAKPFTLADKPLTSRSRTAAYQGAVADPALAGLLTGDGPEALRAARFLAGLSLVALEAPRQERGIVVVTPPDWDPPARLLGATLRGLQANPALLPATLDELFEAVPPETGATGKALIRALDKETGPSEPGSAAARILAARARLASFSSLMGGGQPIPKTAEHALLTGEAVALEPDARADYLGAVEEMIRNVAGRVRGPDRQRVTLTARRASIPISLLNPNSEPLQVRIRLESDQLQFPEGAERLITLPPQNTTEKFVVVARSSGAFPLVINVLSPDGGLLVSRSEITIRSTVVSGMGAFLTASAGVFLLVWWANHLRRARRNGRPRDRRRLSRDVDATAPDGVLGDGPADEEPETAAAVTSPTG